MCSTPDGISIAGKVGSVCAAAGTVVSAATTSAAAAARNARVSRIETSVAHRGPLAASRSGVVTSAHEIGLATRVLGRAAEPLRGDAGAGGRKARLRFGVDG